MKKSFSLLRFPDTINATTFTSEGFTQFLRRNGIKHIKGSPYHPASNGVVERQKHAHDSHSKSQEFNVGDKVYARNYGIGPVWLPGIVYQVGWSCYLPYSARR